MTRPSYARVGIAGVLAALPFGAILGLFDMRNEKPDHVLSDATPTVATLAIESRPPATLASVTDPATAHSPAVRVSVTQETRHATTTTWGIETPPLTCESYVNALPYEWMNLEPARLAYQETARCMGWGPDVVSRWEAFIVDDVIRHESGGCPNLRRGAVVDVWLGCVLSRQGTREDTGFGQLIGLWWRGPGTPVCDRLGLCTSNAIIANGWNSMRSLLVAVETDGRGPWCFDARARRLHAECARTPRRWPS